jgi:carboxymethylenebutenolidase
MAQTQPEGYLATPPGGEGPGVLVLHAWWGLNDTIKALCDRLAEAGFVVFAPDLYHGKVADTIDGAEALMEALDSKQAKPEIVEAAKYLRQRAEGGDTGIAVIGFSLGAYYALDLSNAAPDLVRSVVVFYGTGPDDFSKSRAEYLGHFAGNDDFEPRESVDALESVLKSAGRPVTVHHYDGTGHWFFEPDRVDAYNAAAAALAWSRTLEFLKRTSGGA